MTGRGSWAAVAAILAAVLGAVWGCAGDGTGLDEFGNPLDPGTVRLEPTLGSIQRNVFTPVCTPCHTGAAAPQGLRLDAGVARSYLVDVPSTELPGLFRVRTGEPDASYLVWKVEGRSGIVGGRMPLGSPPLSTEQVTAIREWIRSGASDE